MFLSECTLIYVDPKASDELIKWTTKAFSSHLYFLVYEQIVANVRFCQVMVQNLEVSNHLAFNNDFKNSKERGIALKSLHRFHSLKAQEERFRRNGFDEVAVKDMKDVYYNFLDKEDVERF